MLEPAPETHKPTAVDRQSATILALVSVVQLMAIIDAAVVNVALPSIKTALHVSQVDVQWVINAYTLIVAGLLLLGGRAADLRGRRSVLMAGLVLF